MPPHKRESHHRSEVTAPMMAHWSARCDRQRRSPTPSIAPRASRVHAIPKCPLVSRMQQCCNNGTISAPPFWRPLMFNDDQNPPDNNSQPPASLLPKKEHRIVHYVWGLDAEDIQARRVWGDESPAPWED